LTTTPHPKALVIDDDDAGREMLSTVLATLGYRVDNAPDGETGIAKLDETVDLVFLDVNMPGMNGFEVARQIRAGQHGEVPIIITTALDTRDDRLEAVDAGASDFISKPIDLTELQVRARAQVHLKRARDELHQQRAELEVVVEQRTKALRFALDKMTQQHRRTRDAHLDTIRRLVTAAEYNDDDTGLHIQRMSRYAELIARTLGLDPSICETIRHAAPMHDVGKIGIADAILLKPGKLDAEEWSVMKTHTTIGGHILRGSPSALLQEGETIALSHHERWNGTGYPKGLCGEDIPVSGRICAVADVFDALTSKRPYKEPFPVEKAIAIMREEEGKQFDPAVLTAFLDQLEEVTRIKESAAEEPPPPLDDDEDEDAP